MIDLNFMILLCNIMIAEISLSGVIVSGVFVLKYLASRHARCISYFNLTCKDKRNSGNHDII